MSKRTQTARKGGKQAAWLLILAGTAVFGGVFAYVKLNPDANTVPEADRRNDRAVTPAGEKIATKKPGQVQVVKPVYQDEDLTFDKEDVKVPQGGDPVVIAINKFLKDTKIVPEEAVLKSARLEKGVMTLDFSSAFDRTYGTDDERTLINGLSETLKQFEGTRFMKILVEGQSIEPLGSVDLTENLSID